VQRENKHVQMKQDGKKRKCNKQKKSELHCENLQTKGKKCKASKAKEL
jgi:hypothetical protein